MKGFSNAFLMNNDKVCILKGKRSIYMEITSHNILIFRIIVLGSAPTAQVKFRDVLIHY